MSQESDRTEIIRVLDRYAEALDGRDWPLLGRGFSPDVEFDFGEWTDPARKSGQPRGTRGLYPY